MESGAEKSAPLVMYPPLVKVCSLLNAEEAEYIVVGGFACILHGVVRSTEDVDILMEERTVLRRA